jgi:hypothetical protein
MLLFAHAKNGEEHNHEQKSYPTQLKSCLKTLISNVFHCDGWGWIEILSMSMHEVGRTMANIFKGDKSYLTKWMWQSTNAIQHSLSWACIKFSPFPSLIPWHPLPNFLFFYAYVVSRKVKVIQWHPLPNFLFPFAYVVSRKDKVIPWHPLPNFLFFFPI